MSAPLAQAVSSATGLPGWVVSAAAGGFLGLIAWFFRRLLSDLESRSERAQQAADEARAESDRLRARIAEIERRCASHEPVLRACESCQRARLASPFAAPEGAE
jgi:hypothetical protein